MSSDIYFVFCDISQRLNDQDLAEWSNVGKRITDTYV